MKKGILLLCVVLVAVVAIVVLFGRRFYLYVTFGRPGYISTLKASATEVSSSTLATPTNYTNQTILYNNSGTENIKMNINDAKCVQVYLMAGTECINTIVIVGECVYLTTPYKRSEKITNKQVILKLTPSGASVEAMGITSLTPTLSKTPTHIMLHVTGTVVISRP